MKALEIDKLVRWAIVDELPKGRPVAASPWDRLVSYGRLGTRVDISGYGSGGGLGIVPCTPHPDAERIGDAIAALPKNAQLMEEDCAALLGTYAQLDAETVRRSSGRKRYDLQGLMVRNAILGAPKIDCERPYPASLRHVANGRVIVHSMREGQIEEARAHPKNGEGSGRCLRRAQNLHCGTSDWACSSTRSLAGWKSTPRLRPSFRRALGCRARRSRRASFAPKRRRSFRACR